MRCNNNNNNSNKNKSWLWLCLLLLLLPIVIAMEKPEKEWGSYYDPQNIFCGKYDCYRILGFDYESFGANPPDAKDVTKSYRNLSRKWHPDKNKDRGAKDRFLKINRAYEILTNEETRKEYDFLRYRSDEYFNKYGSSVLWNYAPKSDASFVIILLIVVANIASWYIQKSRWQQVADHLVKAATEDWSIRDGGSTESIELREKAVKKLAEKEKTNNNNTNSSSHGSSNANATTSTTTTTKATNTSSSSNGTTSTKQRKLTKQEQKKEQQEAIRAVVTELVNEIDDFGAGFHKPTWRDLLVVKLAKLPLTMAGGIVWNSKYFYRRMKKLELNEEERQVLTQRAVGHVAWEASSDEQREDMVKRDLWISKNLEEYKEEQELLRFAGGNPKKAAKLKKRMESYGYKEE